MCRTAHRSSKFLPASLALGLTLAASGCGKDRSDSRVQPSESEKGPATVLLTEVQKTGEAIYKRENCGRCHTLFDRPRTEGETPRPGGASAEALGSRVGPDLGLEGHRRSDEWQYAHLYAPSALVPASRMPASRHLFRPSGGRPVPTDEAVNLVAYMQALGRARRDVWAEWRRSEPVVPSPPGVDETLMRRGDELYRDHCAACHGIDGDGRGALADFFSFKPRDFTAGRYRFKSAPFGAPPADADLFRTITIGAGTGSGMPAFDWLPERDRWALVLRVKEFSATLRGSGLRVERQEPEPGIRGRGETDVAAGKAIWDRLGCAACHGPTGAGLSREQAHAEWSDGAGVPVPRSGDLTHACALRAGASPEAIRRAVLFGVGESMPAYADALPDEAGRMALVSFIRSLDAARPVDRLAE
jgi:mono/diheme cytochrome c family protein